MKKYELEGKKEKDNENRQFKLWKWKFQWSKKKYELKLNVDEQQDLKEYCDIDDIQPPWKERALCVTCNQPFAWILFGKHIQEKYTKLFWNYCGEMFE